MIETKQERRRNSSRGETSAMKLILLVNAIESEHPEYTTTHLAFSAARRGHQVWYADVEGFSSEPDGSLCVRAVRAPRGHRTPERFYEALQAAREEQEQVELTAGDVLWLRNNPADDASARPWAQIAGITFGAIAKRHGVLVLNDPDGLANAVSKIYLQSLPDEVRPATLIARNRDALRTFVKTHGAAVIKPIGGSGGRGVFVVRNADEPNFNVIVDAVLAQGYAVAQEYLPAAAGGGVRLFLVNGRMLEVGGKIAAIRRLPTQGDARSNVSAGGKVLRAKIDDRIRAIAELVRPKLVEDGMFVVGLDIAGDRIMEVNVFSPGGLNAASQLEKVDFISALVRAVEDKHHTIERYDHRFDNRVVATL
jgi:glutathione synthase